MFPYHVRESPSSRENTKTACDGRPLTHSSTADIDVSSVRELDSLNQRRSLIRFWFRCTREVASLQRISHPSKQRMDEESSSAD